MLKVWVACPVVDVSRHRTSDTLPCCLPLCDAVRHRQPPPTNQDVRKTLDMRKPSRLSPSAADEVAAAAAGGAAAAAAAGVAGAGAGAELGAAAAAAVVSGEGRAGLGGPAAAGSPAPPAPPQAALHHSFSTAADPMAQPVGPKELRLPLFKPLKLPLQVFALEGEHIVRWGEGAVEEGGGGEGDAAAAVQALEAATVSLCT